MGAGAGVGVRRLGLLEAVSASGIVEAVSASGLLFMGACTMAGERSLPLAVHTLDQNSDAQV